MERITGNERNFLRGPAVLISWTFPNCLERERNALAISMKAERGLVSHDEFEIVSHTHHPTILGASSDALGEARRRLRDLSARERTLSRDLRRGISGKGEQRGSSYPGNVDQPTRRKQIFASALKRVNGELARRQSIAARETLHENARRALGHKNAKRTHHPATGRRAKSGMNTVESERDRTSVPPSKIGSVTKATQVAQASKDQRQ